MAIKSARFAWFLPVLQFVVSPSRQIGILRPARNLWTENALDCQYEFETKINTKNHDIIKTSRKYKGNWLNG